ncbi:hypothetical protein AB4Y88_07770 [Paenarthrobacter sp. RAF9]
MTTASASIRPENALAGTGSVSRPSLADGTVRPDPPDAGFADAAGFFPAVWLFPVAWLFPDSAGLFAPLLPLPAALVGAAAVDGFEAVRVAPNSALMTSAPLLPALPGPAAPGRGGGVDGRAALEPEPKASALGTFGRRVAMTLL